MSSPKTIPTGEFSQKKKDFAHQCKSILEIFAQSDAIVQAGRNTLKKIEFDGVECVMKAFRIPKFPQDYSYGMISKSKAKKSYDNGNRLLKLGFATPNPVGYFENRAGGKLLDSYYICEFAAEAETLNNLWNAENPPSDELIQQFAEFCYQLHSKGILHRDFNPKNILVTQKENDREFALVDINRITWYDALPIEKAMESLSRLPFSEATRVALLEHYAELSNVDVNKCLTLLKKSEYKTQRYFRNKRRFRKIFPKK